MSYLTNMETRLNYRGGRHVQDRMIKDKLWSLETSINRSYQTITLENSQGQRFRCLLNPDKTNIDYHSSILSIPYKAVDLNDTRKNIKTSDGKVDTNIHNGDIFTWVENNSKWLIYLQDIHEIAYFMADCRQCEAEAALGGLKYPVYIRGPQEQKIEWNTANVSLINKLNYNIEMFITKNEETTDFFHRFTIFKIDGLPYQVQGINWYAGDGIIRVEAKEYYKEEIAESIRSEQKEPTPQQSTIQGPTEIYAYDTAEYSIDYKFDGTLKGEWTLSNKKLKVIENNGNKVKIEAVTGKSGTTILTYNYGGQVIDSLVINIKSI